jgi:catechol 2,3-dioxygenase-like lactoylglutathione lyase family enzyme
MAVSLHHVVIDTHDLPALARFWAQVLGWRILSEREREVVIGADATAPVGICFMPVTDAKTTKNRLHLDLSPDPGEQEAEIERILALSADVWKFVRGGYAARVSCSFSSSRHKSRWRSARV